MEGSRNLILLSDHHGPSPAATPVCPVLLQFVSSSPSGAWEPRLRSVPCRSVLGERSEVTWVRMAAYPRPPLGFTREGCVACAPSHGNMVVVFQGQCWRHFQAGGCIGAQCFGGDIGAISSHMQTLLDGPFPQGKVLGLSSVP